MTGTAWGGTRGACWLLGLLAAAVVIGGGSSLSPLALVPVVAVLGAALLIASPATAVVLALPFVMFGASLAQQPGLGWLQLADEAAIGLLAVAFLARAVMTGRSLLLPAGARWIGAFLLIGLASSVTADVPWQITLEAAALSGKGWLLAVIVAQVDWTGAALRRLLTVGGAAAVVAVGTSAVNLVAPEWWQAVVAASGPVEYRLPFPSLVGPFTEAIVFGQVLVLATGVCLAIAATATGRYWQPAVWATVLCGICALLSARRFVALALLAALLLVIYVRRNAATWVVALAALPVAVAALLPALSAVWSATAAMYFSATTEAARTVMTLKSFTVAADYFPLGAGLGRYGSYPAGVHYSPLYRELGFDEVYGLQPDPPNDAFLTDTFWPAVLGESGYIGAACYVAALVAVLMQGRRLYRRHSGSARTVGLLTMVVWIEAVVLSISGAALTTPAMLVIPFVVLGVARSVEAREADTGAPDAGSPDPGSPDPGEQDDAVVAGAARGPSSA
jgi:hypothetical protein